MVFTLRPRDQEPNDEKWDQEDHEKMRVYGHTDSNKEAEPGPQTTLIYTKNPEPYCQQSQQCD